MQPTVRIMSLEETVIITDYFNSSSPEHLELMGVDPTRLPDSAAQKRFIELEYEKPLEQRKFVAVIWLLDDEPIGFSTAEKIQIGKHAFMHLHVVKEDLRNQGLGAACVKQSAAIYFEQLKLQRLFCEPNAFNVAPNRTLQKSGFTYVKTHNTVPGPLNYHQAVNRWVFE